MFKLFRKPEETIPRHFYDSAVKFYAEVVTGLDDENARLRDDLAAVEALLAESEALRVATVEKLQAVEAERDDARQRLGRAFEAVYNPADPPWANTSH